MLAASGPLDLDAYISATKSLLGAIRRFRSLASRRLGIPVTIGIPIGGLTSRVIANLALATMDAHVEGKASVIAYRRYVDDIVIVAKADADVTVEGALNAFLPISETGDVLRLDVDALDRVGSEFQLQRNKLRIHHLSGDPGEDFVEAVRADFDRLVSRSRAFLDATSLREDGASHLVRTGAADEPPLHVLRDADRTRLEHFALSTRLRTLERASVLVSVEEAQSLVRSTLERVGRVLQHEDDWVENLETAFRVLRLAIGTAD